MTFEKMAYHFYMAEKYLVKEIKPNIAAESFDDLRCLIYAIFFFFFFSIYAIGETTFSK